MNDFVNQNYALKYCECSIDTFRKFFPHPEKREQNDRGYWENLYSKKNLDIQKPIIRNHLNKVSADLMKSSFKFHKNTAESLKNDFDRKKDWLDFNDVSPTEEDEDLEKYISVEDKKEQPIKEDFTFEKFKNQCKDFLNYRDSLLLDKKEFERKLKIVVDEIEKVDSFIDSLKSNHFDIPKY